MSGVTDNADVERPAPAFPAPRPATDAERRAVASVVRLRILRLCRYEPLTNKEIADRLGRNPASVLHHVRTLVANGFLAPGPARPGRRGSTEIPYTSTNRSWTLDFGPDEQDRGIMLQAFFDEVSMVPPAEVASIRLGLQLSAVQFDEFTARLYGLLDEFARRPLDPDGERRSVFLAIHPEP